MIKKSKFSLRMKNERTETHTGVLTRFILGKSAAAIYHAMNHYNMILSQTQQNWIRGLLRRELDRPAANRRRNVAVDAARRVVANAVQNASVAGDDDAANAPNVDQAAAAIRHTNQAA